MLCQSIPKRKILKNILIFFVSPIDKRKILLYNNVVAWNAGVVQW